MTNTHITREQWLNKGVALISPLFPEELPKKIRVSVGWPSTKALSQKMRRIGECWSDTASADHSHEIFISPYVEEPITVLGVLIHELIHATVGLKHGHKTPFKRLAIALGLTGKMTSTEVGTELKPKLQAIIKTLGKFPHAMLQGTNGRKKQGTRLIKAHCPSCGYVIRLSLKWVEMGLPTCICGDQFIEA